MTSLFVQKKCELRFVLLNVDVESRNTLHWRHNGRDGVANHQPHDCLLKRLSRRKSKKTSKLRVTGFCAGNSPVTGEFPAQMASNAENVSIWWRHHEHQIASGGLDEAQNHQLKLVFHAEQSDAAICLKLCCMEQDYVYPVAYCWITYCSCYIITNIIKHLNGSLIQANCLTTSIFTFEYGGFDCNKKLIYPNAI